VNNKWLIASSVGNKYPLSPFSSISSRTIRVAWALSAVPLKMKKWSAQSNFKNSYRTSSGKDQCLSKIFWNNWCLCTFWKQDKIKKLSRDKLWAILMRFSGLLNRKWTNKLRNWRWSGGLRFKEIGHICRAKKKSKEPPMNFKKWWPKS
jgi:hypothetical protein